MMMHNFSTIRDLARKVFAWTRGDQKEIIWSLMILFSLIALPVFSYEIKTKTIQTDLEGPKYPLLQVALRNSEECKESCKGTIFIRANYDQTGPFLIYYHYADSIIVNGPYFSKNEIVLEHLCPGDYTKIGIRSVGALDTYYWKKTLVIHNGV